MTVSFGITCFINMVLVKCCSDSMADQTINSRVFNPNKKYDICCVQV